jgi:transglutaminase-like putative cysteine protease
MNRYKLHHVTEFTYDGLVSESFNEVRLRPLEDERQSCLRFRLSTQPQAPVSARLDYYGNWVHQFNVLAEHRHLRVESESVVLVQPSQRTAEVGPSLAEIDRMHLELEEEHYEYLAPTGYVPHHEPVHDMIAEGERACDGTALGFVQTACNLVHTRFRYEKGATHVNSSIQDSMSSGKGVCQDFAHVLLAIVRMRGLPGRYVSGYLIPRQTAEAGSGTEEIIGGQASHAWMEVYVPGPGWTPLDPTFGRPVGVQHVRIGYGRDYGDVAPVRGVYKGHAGQHLSVDVLVRPALNDEGHEHLVETVAAPLGLPPDSVPQQQQQQ